MACKIRYIYDNTVNLDDVYDKIIEDMETNYISEAVVYCKELKKNNYPTPVGFSIIEYDEFDLEESPIVSNYYFNATIINKLNAPNNWDKEVFINHKEFIYVNENFCIPYDRKTDKILKTNI